MQKNDLNTVLELCSEKYIEDNDTHYTYIKEETLPSVNRRGVESITSIGSTAGWTTGPFTVVDAKIVCFKGERRGRKEVRV